LSGRFSRRANHREDGSDRDLLTHLYNRSLDHAVVEHTLAREFGDLVKRARAGGLRSSEMSDATITVSNLGDLGVDSAYAIIYPPQVAIVGFGRIVERPWVVDGRIEPRSVVTVSVSADHRATNGREAGLFLTAIDRSLQAPESL
jgi:pyruvate dehydrogenase E2 component (dihydrolipoamide acetyltransferase)